MPSNIKGLIGFFNDNESYSTSLDKNGKNKRAHKEYSGKKICDKVICGLHLKKPINEGLK